ncbi:MULTISPECIES: hypothetical protein [Helicobacter]|uniref:hypothetical protein n=1 Tax=Helicobacter TaxID=209 RepID=UPI0012BC211F|nr:MULTISPECIES: hypothetical protein [Helicobacter]
MRLSNKGGLLLTSFKTPCYCALLPLHALANEAPFVFCALLLTRFKTPFKSFACYTA